MRYTAAAWSRFVASGPPAVVGLVLFTLCVGLALLAPAVAPYDPVEQSIDDRYIAPSWQHPMGTDKFGRDVMSRVLVATRTSLGVGVAAMLLASLVGGMVRLRDTAVGGWTNS